MSVYLRWHKKTRFYEACLRQDLLRDWVVVISWGSRVRRAGRLSVKVVSDELSGIQKINQISKRRKQRGYEAV